MRIKRHTENDARKLARRRFKSAFVQIVAHGGRKDVSGDYRPIKINAPVVFFVETDIHREGVNPVWETVIFAGHGRQA